MNSLDRFRKLCQTFAVNLQAYRETGCDYYLKSAEVILEVMSQFTTRDLLEVRS